MFTAGRDAFSSVFIRRIGQPRDKMAVLLESIEHAIGKFRDGDCFLVPAVALPAVGVRP